MLDSMTMIGIFTEILAGGVLLFGAFAFLKRGLEEKQTKDMVLGLVFLAFAAHIALALSTTLMHNLGRPVSQLMLLQKSSGCVLIIGSLLIFTFIKERFKLGWMRPVLWAYAAACAVMCYRISASTFDLVFYEGVIEPFINNLSMPTPTRSLWVLSWLALAFTMGANAVRVKGNRRTLLLYGGISSAIVFLSYPSMIAYTATAESYYLLLAWGLSVVGAVGLMLSEIIPPDSPLAKNPASFFKSRILFKLIFIFVLLIVILFEVTTIATLTLARQALRSSIFDNYRSMAQTIADQISDLPNFDGEAIDRIIDDKRIGRAGAAYVVDKNGLVIAHLDRTWTDPPKELGAFEPVKLALAGGSGAMEFPRYEGLEVSFAGGYAPVERHGGAVIVEEPTSFAYHEMRILETNSLLFVIAGIFLTVLTGILLTRKIEDPIHKLMVGTEAISSGNLSHRINVDSIDEIGMLAQAFNKMTHDLRDSQERLILSEKLASLGTMAAGMAHEIKNPLVSLRTFSQLLQQKWEDKEFRDKFSQIVPTEIERINKIAESLLKFGRPMKPEMKRVNVNMIIEEILMLFESECKKNSIRVSMKLAELPEIIGDTQQLSQAFVNIILNGIQAMEKGGELVIKTDVGEVVRIGGEGKTKVEEDGSVVFGEEEGSQKPVKSVFIEISDTGPGIAAENLKALFDPFFTTKVKGTGMGLPITLRIIEEHKGSVKVKSELGKGTSFLITMPVESSG